MASNASNETLPVTYNPYDYPCNDGLLLPITSEFTWPTWVRATLYLVALLWSFLAVAIVADIFMCAIERITSKTRIVRIPDSEAPEGFRELKLKVWNDTVANLSLMALGTSAPEILLSVIEIVGNEFVAGDLGPGTIVGSASYNLLFITAICIMCIPAGATRRVANMRVYAVTAFTSVFAYVWLVIVLLVISPNKIELWEAIVTFIFFPVLVILAYAAEKNFFFGRKVTEMEPTFGGIAMDGKVTEETRPLKPKLDEEDEIILMAKELGREDDVTEQEAARIVANKILVERPHDRAWHRINATRGLTGGRKLVPKVLKTFEDLYDRVQGPADELEDRASAIVPVDHSEGGRHAVVEFTAAALAVMENEGKVRVGLRRHGKLNSPAKVRVETINGTAVAGEDYKPINEVVIFAPNETLRQVYIDIVDDFEWEPDEVFFVRLHTESDDEVRLGNISICQITIINDDEPGVLAFPKPGFIIKESGMQALIPVVRTGGADGHVSIRWRTGDITAVNGKDYSGGEGELVFDNQETSKVIEISLFETNKKERDDSFQIELMDAGGGATLGKLNKCIVTVVSDEEYTGLVSRIVNQAKANLDPLQLENATYAQQFYEAMNVNGGDVETASLIDYVMHFLTFYWKIMFAFIPPTQYFGGWPTFVISLAIIGFLTAIIGDLASIFGCVVGLPDAITAITFVALGTSMPDTFASKSAATLEKTADNSVGNVNGSNSVNVFLGLGLPWLIAAIYWKVQNGSDFDVPAGSLGFSVILYTITAIIAIAILMLRRFLVGAELGGPSTPKYVSGAALIVLWFLYVLFSSLQTTGVIDVTIG